MREPQGDGWIGRPLKRREDHRLLTGAGAFVDDMTPPGCLHVALLRSPHAHARIAHLDVEAARQAPARGWSSPARTWRTSGPCRWPA
jgi:carbon-monoxide dehydrogenase large subunit